MIVWNDIEHLTKNYNSGLKKLDGLNENEKFNKNKTNRNKNKFHFNPSNDEYGLDEKYTIRPFHIKYDSSFNKLMSNKSTPSKSLGKHSLSSGSLEAIKLTKKLIPKIDYSYTDPQYYEHKLQGKTTKDLILKELSKGKKFAKEYMERQNMGIEDINANIKPVYPSSSSPPPSPSRSSSKTLSSKERKSIQMMDEIENSSQPFPSLTPTSNKLSFGKRLNNDELHIGPASFSTNTPTKIRGITEDDFTSNPNTPFAYGGGGGGGYFDLNEIENNMDVETETENENDKVVEKTHRQLQLAKNHQDRKELRKTLVPTDIDKMKLPELQAMAKHMGIDIENNEPGKGKGRGHKKIKTVKQLRTEIESKRNAPKLKLIRNKKNDDSEIVVYSKSK